MTLEDLEKQVETERHLIRTLDRTELVNAYLTLLICKELKSLKEEVASLKELVKPEVKEASKPGRKKTEKEE